jgi:hypothetical protein
MKKSNLAQGRNRRSFLRSSLAGAAAAATSAVAGGTLLAKDNGNNGQLDRGDAAIIRFVAAAELIETDLWQQYAELGGVSTDNPYTNAFENLDDDGPQYISSNTLDELTHAEFLNAYLISKGEEPVDLDRFRTLQGSTAEGALDTPRLTNLMQLKIDTSWYTRYRSNKNPDFGATFPQAIPALFSRHVTAIPRSNADFSPAKHIQVIANTAAFHFASIEQGGSSLYPTLGQKVTSVEVLKIMFSIGGDEVAHFLEWMDFAGNAASSPVAPVTDPTNGLTFPDLNATNNPLLQTNLIFPVPCEFISPKLPRCAVIRPTSAGQIDALGAANFLITQGLFTGQPKSFFELLLDLAHDADSAKRDPIGG